MKFTWDFRLTLTVTVFIAALNLRFVSSCTCMPSHPQQQYCNSDFVLLVKVKAAVTDDTDRSVAYHVAIKKIFKMADKVSIALKPKILWSAQHDSMCGVNLKTNSKYLVAGRVSNNKPWISLCSYHELWNSISTKQKKGFRLLYKQGCECKIQVSYCQMENVEKCPRNHNTCLWGTWRDTSGGCQSKHGVCMPQAHGKCEWNKSRDFRTCLKERKERRHRQRQMEP